MSRKPTQKQRRFVEELLADPNRNATKAYRLAYPECNSDEAARAGASRTLASASVQKALAEADAARAKRLEIDADDVLRHWWLIANADPNELVEYRRTSCRYCHGRDHGYHRTRGELGRDRAAWRKKLDEEREKGGASDPQPFDEQGGEGYDPRKSPHPDCPECFGEGVGRAFPKDTRNLGPAAARLYAGARETREGVEIKMRDQDAALVNVAKHVGMFEQKKPLQLDVTSGGLPLERDSLTAADFAAVAGLLAQAGLGVPQDGGPQPVDPAQPTPPPAAVPPAV